MFGVDGNLPVDGEKLLADEKFFEKYASLAQLSARSSWAGFDDSKAKALKERIDSDWKHLIPLSLYREAENSGQDGAGGLTLSELFEKLDPSPRGRNGEVLTPADAFERQVMLAVGDVGGNFGSIRLEQLYGKGAPAVLLPELLRRWVIAGMQMKSPSVDKLIAVTAPITGSAFRPIYIPTADVDTETDLGLVGAGAGELPKLQIMHRDKTIDSKVFGRVIDVAYRVIQHAPMAKLEMIYKFVGLNLATSLVGSVWTTLKNGDGSSGAISGGYAISGTAGSGTLSYSDLINMFFAVNEVFHINALIGSAAVLVDLLTLSQFQDPEAGFAFQKTGDLSAFRPLGSQLYRYDSATDHLIVGLDTNWAIEKGVESEMMIETEKIISSQFEESAISESHAYAVANDGARASLDFS